MSGFNYSGGQLCAEQVPLSEIARRVGTPCYVYSRGAIESNWRAYDAAFGGRRHLVCFAVKANGTLAVLQLLARLGAGFDIVSGGELERVIAAGADPSRVIFSGVGKRRDEMQQALLARIRCFNVESRSELLRLNEVASSVDVKAPVALRINPDVDPDTHPYIATGLRQSKFGIAYEEAVAACREAAALPHIQVCGVACHIGSQITSPDPFDNAVDRMAALLIDLRGAGIEPGCLDMGGGMGIRYRDESPPAPERIVRPLCESIPDPRVELVLEPGRSIVGNAGVLLTRVEYIKQNGGRYFAVVDAGMNDLLRPALYDAWHEILPVASGSDAPQRAYDVVGPVCESGDFLGRSRGLRLAEGDLLAVCSAGAYGACMGSNYNARPRPAEVLVSAHHEQVIRGRESIADLMRGETLI